ncbi:hypothetical protein GCM10009858_44460 [Terrabacter carboxydivorans]|uniref:DUF726 domain-containing protein n=2 Tax=Terrabacter carboxydivorans TaxID=619730 RepID=A0ABN3MGS0_9MICO
MIEGAQFLRTNVSIVSNAWAFALHEKLRRGSRSAEERKSHEAQAAHHKKLALRIAELADMPSADVTTAWCSSCLEFSGHARVKVPVQWAPARLCRSCGAPTVECAAPKCGAMADRGIAAIRLPRFCAEHRHEIASFGKANMRLVDLSEWQRLRVFEKPNLARGTRIVGGVGLGLATVATAGFVAAPAIGGAIGAATAGYSGAAATSYGLAFLGGGAVAAGGLGVAGGTAVITVVGGALGGSLGAKAMNDYVGEDQSFRIEKVKDGPGTPVIFASGFLSDRVDTWGGWKPMIERRYPNSSVYRVHWGAKELADLWNLTMQGGFKAAASKSVTALARKATASASRLVAPAGAVLAGLDVLTNPWFTAKSRAAKTAVALSDLIARTDEPAYILVGHSLGARVMVLTAALLATKREAPHIADMHLLGAAVAASIDKRPLNDAVGGTVHNYYSRRDNVLRILYRAAELGETPAGSQGFNSAYPRITDHDVSTLVSDHFSYLRAVTLR